MGRIQEYKHYAPAFIRIALSLVFLWFGLNQLFNSNAWISWLPPWMHMMHYQPATFIQLNGLMETALGALLLLGMFTRVAALVLGIHLLGIAFTVGYNDVGIRDMGLGLVTLGVFMQGHDILCLDNKLINKKNPLLDLLYVFDR